MSDRLHPPTTSHNYMPKVIALGIAHSEKFVECDVRHDEWCDALNGRGFCNCDPAVTIMPNRN